MSKTKPYIPPAIPIIRDNIIKSGNPLALTHKDCSNWATNLDIPREGKIILYTGCEYQMTPFIQPLREALKKFKFQDGLLSLFQKTQGISEITSIDPIRTLTKLSGGQRKTYDEILKASALILKKLKVDFAYLEDEIYSGALLYELGFFSDCENQAKLILKQFEKSKVNKIITLTPHSAEMFLQVYPEILGNFPFEVTTFVQVLRDALDKSGEELKLKIPLTATLHDPCHFARSLNIIEEPRDILNSIKNLELKEVASNKLDTICCGAPCELVYPELAEIAGIRRAKELSDTGAKAIITLCPFCHANLSIGIKHANLNIKLIDFIEIIYQAMESHND